MIILSSKTPATAGSRKQIILLFGLGLIGREIFSVLDETGNYNSHEIIFHWDISPEYTNNFNKISIKVSKLLSESNHEDDCLPTELVFVWSAGKGSFGSNEAELKGELNNFNNVLNFFNDLSCNYPTILSTIHMLSSAGGLYEGQRFINADTAEKPLRAYGFLKLKQEKIVADAEFITNKYIYRPSSVYGYVRSKSRIGLIPSLMVNGICHQVSNVYVNMNTLRDYVFASDIGQYIGNTIVNNSSQGITKIIILASGRSSSVYEIKFLIEKLISRSIYVQYSPGYINPVDNSYARDVLPSHWNPTALETGISRIHLDLLENTAIHGLTGY
jgi:UDP-glucose 4-epimerase